LQKYILAKDSKALPKYKADGKWGKETEDAMYKYFFSLITIKDGKISVDSQEQMDKIKAASKPTYKAGSPLVFQYQSPMGQVSPLLTIK
jgi:ssDNA-specific exonuclease RecJ